MFRFLGIAFFLLFFASHLSAQKIAGSVTDANNGEPIIGANVVIKGTGIGTSTDFDGQFSLDPKDQQPPYQLEISFIGYQTKTMEVTDATEELNIELQEDSEMLGEVSVIEQRLSEKQRESALTVEAMDAIAIKETPAVNFYEGLGNLKGVDLTSASIGFKVINTRGFNSTSPVRSLQLIDGVDNQAPGLNFSLGNFLGASELDIQNVDIIAGASSAFYGPGAFNGVISMTTKNPFDYQGISASVKVGERALTETAVRYAEAFKLGKDYENLAFKINLYYLTANDWEATNYEPVYESEVDADNPGRYDAINIYGDEDLTGGADFRGDVTSVATTLPNSYAGLEKFYRSGYREPDLVDYDTRNFKGNLGLHYKFTEDVELSYTLNYGTGTTVYQGENRFSLKNIQFFQNIVQLEKEDKFFLRAYATQEDAGDSYDAVLTAFKMNREIVDNNTWNTTYTSIWRNQRRYGRQFIELLGGNYLDYNMTPQEWYDQVYLPGLEEHKETLQAWHADVLALVDTFSFNRPVPGTQDYDSLFNRVTSRTFTEGGSKFFDRSALYHIMGEYQFHPSWADIRVGGNYRLYMPNSRGNIFDELVIDTQIDSNGTVTTDTTLRKIQNEEFGFYAGIEHRFYDEKVKVSLTTRVDKNQNFNYLFSPAASVIYDINSKHTARVSFSSAIRNPTLQDQYLRYNVGRAILLGNLNGFDSLVTVESFDEYRNNQLDRDRLDYFNVDPIRPERVRTLEVGYRATLFDRFFVDMNYYHNWYRDFIGFQFGLDLNFPDPNTNLFQTLQAYRVSANAEELVTSQGFNLGLNYYITDELTFNGNYSYNDINLRPKNTFLNQLMYGEEVPENVEVNPIIPAFNTPEHKFNLGITGRGYKLIKGKDHQLGFAVTYKWVEGFLFEGSPQFTGFIDSYDMLDAQVSYRIPKIYTTFKLGASNVLNNEVFQVYGGPTVGRLAYVSLLFEKF